MKKMPAARTRPTGRDAAPAWYRVGPVVALADDQPGAVAGERSAATSADVYVYDTIGGWFGMTADDFVRDVASLDVDQLVLHLNSPGGDAFEGVAIANVLRAHRARVVVRIDGMAASAASVIAMAGDEVVMGIGSQMMIHEPAGIVVGDAAEVERFVRRLNAAGDSLASTYAARAGGTSADWREVMRAETWYTAEEAVTAKLADRVAAADEKATAEGEQITPGGSDSFWDLRDQLSATDRFDLSGFRYAGREHAPPPAMPGRTTPAATAAGTTEREGGPVPFTAEHLKTMRQALGLAADADEGTIAAALVEALTEQADGPAATSAEVVDQLEALKGDNKRMSEELAAIKAKHAADDKTAFFAKAKETGRLKAADEAEWSARWDKPGGAEFVRDVVGARAAGSEVPVAALGYAGDPAATGDKVTADDDGWLTGFAGPAPKEA